MSDYADPTTEDPNAQDDLAQDQAMIDLHTEAMEEFDAVYTAQRQVRQKCLQARRFCFVPGAQYDDRMRLQFQNKPMMEMNKSHLHVEKIINDLKSNEITVNYKAKDGSEDSITADSLDGMLRADEQASNAEEAYDAATEEAVSGGMGAWRYVTEWEDPTDPDNDHQVIRIKPIFDADQSVYFDLGAKRADKADAKRCWIISSKTSKDFEAEWPDKSPTSWPREVPWTYEWFGTDVIYVAEYYLVESKNEYMHFFTGPADAVKKYWTSDLTDELKQELADSGFTETKTRKVERRQVHKYVLSGNEVLEDCGVIAGEEIPVVVQAGERRYIDNVEWYVGAVLYMMDPQVAINVQVSKLVQIAGYSSRSIPIVTPEQIVNHDTAWNNQNVTEPAFLQLNQTYGPNGEIIPAVPQAYTQPPQVPPALEALLTITNQLMLDIGGDMAPQEQLPTDISGVALDSIYARSDRGNFGFLHNKANAIKRGGVIYKSMASVIYTDKGRKMKTVSAQGQTGSVVLMQPHADAPGGIANDFAKASLDVVVDVGPASATKRDAMVRQLTHLVATIDDPQLKSVLQNLIVYNLDAEGMADVRPFFRNNLVQMGAVKPTDEEQKAMDEAKASQQPNSTDQANMALAQKLQADAQLSQAKITEILEGNAKTQAETEKLRTETVQIFTTMQQTMQEQALQQQARMDAFLAALTQPGAPQPATQPQQQ